MPGWRRTPEEASLLSLEDRAIMIVTDLERRADGAVTDDVMADVLVGNSVSGAEMRALIFAVREVLLSKGYPVEGRLSIRLEGRVRKYLRRMRYNK